MEGQKIEIMDDGRINGRMEGWKDGRTEGRKVDISCVCQILIKLNTIYTMQSTK